MSSTKKACENCAKRTLWKAKLNVQGAKQEMLFRSTDEFGDASTEASRLLDASPGAEMSGATIMAIEKIARLWN